MIAFLCTNNERSEREIRGTIPCVTAPKRIKYLGINLPKGTKDLYSENEDAEERNQKMTHKQMERHTMFLDWKNQYCPNDHMAQGNLQILCNPYQVIKGILHKTRCKKTLYLHRNTENPE